MIPIFAVFAAPEKGISSNINEVIKTVLNLLLFFTKRFYTHKKAKKSTKSTKKQKNRTKQKHKNANKRTKIKNALKNIQGEKVTYSLICVFVLATKKVSTMEMLNSVN